MNQEPTVYLYSDASFAGPGSRGGAGVVLVNPATGAFEEYSWSVDFGKECIEHAELTALLFGLRSCGMDQVVAAHLDSLAAVRLLVRSGLMVPEQPVQTETTLASPSLRHQRRAREALDRHAAVLHAISNEVRRFPAPTRILWVRGHGVNPWNLRADRLADQAASEWLQLKENA